MNRSLILFASAVFSMPILAQDLATYSIELAVDGMAIEGALPGVGDRSLRFELKLDPADAEAANVVWYENLEALLGPDEVAKIRASAEKGWRQDRR